MAIGVVGTVVATTAFAGTALADFPNFADCPTGAAGVTNCVDMQSTAGTLTIKKLNIDLGSSLEIRGGWNLADGTVVAPDGTSGVFSQPVDVPGGIFGVDFPLPGNRLTLQVEKAGTGAITIDPTDLTITAPVKLALHNSILGNCTIGTDAKPVALSLTTGTTSPPAPNEPITGQIGDQQITPRAISFRGNRNVDNAFALGGAKGCNIAAAAIMDSALRAPSGAGKNTLVIDNNLALSR
jgi:hypothetical protein